MSASTGSPSSTVGLAGRTGTQESGRATRRLSEHPFPGLLNIYVKEFPADWETHAKAAGPIRNRRMLEEGKPELVLAFKNGIDHTLSRGGTENTVKQAKALGVAVYLVGAL
jgi:hypothetical protein